MLENRLEKNFNLVRKISHLFFTKLCNAKSIILPCLEIQDRVIFFACSALLYAESGKDEIAVKPEKII